MSTRTTADALREVLSSAPRREPSGREPRRAEQEHFTLEETTSAVRAEPILYTRQSQLDVVVPEVATVIGVGGIGFHVAMNLALLGTSKLLLFDPDMVENHNRNRLPLKEEDVGKNKALVTREHVHSIRPNVTVIAIPTAIEEFNMDMLEGFVYICTDSISSQRDIRKWCVDHNIPFIRIGYDGRHLTIENKPVIDDVWDVSGDDGRYTVVPSYAITPQIAALTAIMLHDMNLWLGFPNKKPNINISGNIFQVGQAVLDGKIFDIPMQYPDRNISGVQFMEVGGRRLQV